MSDLPSESQGSEIHGEDNSSCHNHKQQAVLNPGVQSDLALAHLG